MYFTLKLKCTLKFILMFVCFSFCRVLMAEISEEMNTEDLNRIKFLLGKTISREYLENVKVSQWYWFHSPGGEVSVLMCQPQSFLKNVDCFLHYILQQVYLLIEMIKSNSFCVTEFLGCDC